MKKKSIIIATFLFIMFIPFVRGEDVIKETQQLQGHASENEMVKIVKEINRNTLEIEILSRKLNNVQEELRITIENHIDPLNNRIKNINNVISEYKDRNEIDIWASFFVPLIASIIGATIAGYCSLRATKNAHKNEINKQELNQQKTIRNLLQSLRDEITILWKTYLWGVGDELEKLRNGQPLNTFYPLTQEYCTVYNNNSPLIGSIENNDLRSAIVEAYTMSRSLIDSYRLNNDLVHKYEHWHWLFMETKDPSHAAKAKAQLIALTNYAEKLKEIHFSLKDKVKILIDMIEAENTKV